MSSMLKGAFCQDLQKKDERVVPQVDLQEISNSWLIIILLTIKFGLIFAFTTFLANLLL